MFAVREDYQQILTQVYAGLQETRLWSRVSGSCFCAAGFVSLVFNALGLRSRILPCYAVVIKDDMNFLVGYKNVIAAPGQVDGHVVCLIDNTILVDFGLKNVQRYAWPDFPDAVACEINPDNMFPGQLVLDERRKILWANDWASPATDAVMRANKPVFKKLFKQYRSTQLYGNQCSLNIT